MDTTSIITTLGSAAFAVALVSLIQSAWPKLAGKWVWLVYALIAAGSTALARHAGQVPAWVWEVVGPFAAIVLGLGGHTVASDIASKASTPPPGEAPKP